jgi:DNA-binding SARP family transcriptional activator
MDVQILGPLRVLRDGVEVDLGRPKQRLLLAVLVAAGGDTVSVDRLVDELWGDEPPPRVASSVQAYVSKLRNALEPDRPARAAPRILVTRAPGYALDLPPDRLDATRFASEADEVRTLLHAGRFERAHALAGEALGRWRGDVLADLADEAVARREAPRWHALRLAVAEDRLHAAVELGLHTTAIADLESLVADNPLRERSLGLLLRALYLGGRPVEALERYRAYRAELQEELGLDPGAELQAVEAAILRQDPSLLPSAPTAGPADDATAPPDTDAPRAAGTPQGRPSDASAAADRPTGVTADAAATPTAAAVPADEPDPHGLVGRTDELTVGAAFVEDVRAGRPRWLTLVGEPGIGKTRLVEELATHARRRGFPTAWARCPESGAIPPFWPLNELARQLHAAGVTAGGFSAAATDGPVDAATVFELYRAVIGGLRSSPSPLVMVIDDLQWADADTFRLIAHIAPELSATGALLLVTCRPLDGRSPAALVESLDALARSPGALQLRLSGLDGVEVAEWLERRVDVAVPEEVVRILHDRTDGHPLFLKELSELLVVEGRLGDPEAVASPRAIPPGVQFVVRRRVTRLPAATQQLLSVASVIGRQFDLDVVAHVSGVALDGALDALDPALEAGLVEPAIDGGFRFSHALVADALAAEVNHARRARLHASTARALADRTGASPELVAHHALEGADAGTAELAVTASVGAARAAADRLGYEDAVAHWSRAVAALDRARPGDRTAQARLRCELAAARFRVDQVDDGTRSAVRAIELAEADGDVATMAAAANLLGNPHIWPNRGYGVVDHRAVSALRRTADALADRDPVRHAVVLGALAFELTYASRGEWERIRRAALDAARAADDPLVLARVLMNSVGPLRPSELARRAEAVEEVLSLAERIELPAEVELVARFNRALVHSESAELDRAEEELGRCEALNDRLGVSRVRAQLGWFASAVELARGRHERALALGRAASELYRRTRVQDADLMQMALEGSVAADRGGPDSVGAFVTLADQVRSNYDRLVAEFAAWLLVENGRSDEAGRALSRVGDTGPMADDYTTLVSAALGLHARAELGDREGVAELFEVLRPYSGRWAGAGSGAASGGLVDLALARGAVVLGRDDQARTWFEAATAGHEQLRTPVWLARSLLHHGRFLLGRDRLEAPHGRDLIERAGRLAERHGASNVVRQAERALAAG